MLAGYVLSNSGCALAVKRYWKVQDRKELTLRQITYERALDAWG